MNNASGIILFAFGLGIGATCGYFFAKSKYEALANEEIESVKEAFHQRNECIQVQVNEETTKEPDIIHEEYEKIIAPYKCGPVEEKPQVIEKDPGEAYVISEMDFGEHEDEGWSSVTMFYYADGILADDDEEIIEEPERYFGEDIDIMEYFSDEERDSLYIRNEGNQADYEILRSLQVFHPEAQEE